MVIEEVTLRLLREQARDEEPVFRWLVAAFCKRHDLDPPDEWIEASEGEPTGRTTLKDVLRMQERLIVTLVCERLNYNIAHAARELGMERTTLRSRMGMLGMRSPNAKAAAAAA